MARTGEPEIFSVHPTSFREAQLLRLFRGLSPRYQDVVLVVAESHAGFAGKSTSSEPSAAGQCPDSGAVVVPFPGMRP